MLYNINLEQCSFAFILAISINFKDNYDDVEATPAKIYSKKTASEGCSYLYRHRSRSNLMKEGKLDTNA